MEDKTICKQVNQCNNGSADNLNSIPWKEYINLVGAIGGIAGLIFDVVRSIGTRERVEIVGQVTVVAYNDQTIIAIENVVVLLKPGYACQITYLSDGTVSINVSMVE